MLNLIRKLFSSGPRKVLDIEAKMTSQQEGLYGEAEFEGYEDGSFGFELEVKHHGHTLTGPLSVFIDNIQIGTLDVHNGRSETEINLSSHRGDMLVEYPDIGRNIHITDAIGNMLMGGSFQPDY